MSAKRSKKPARKPTRAAAVTKKPAKKVAKKAAAPRRAATRKAAPKKAPRPQVVHWEIQSQSPDKLHSFYADVFGWEVNTDNPMRYGMVDSGGQDGINGGIGGSAHPGSRVLVYANVPSIDESLAKIEELGGKTLMPRTDVGMVVMALYEDPEGNVMGILED